MMIWMTKGRDKDAQLAVKLPGNAALKPNRNAVRGRAKSVLSSTTFGCPWGRAAAACVDHAAWIAPRGCAKSQSLSRCAQCQSTLNERCVRCRRFAVGSKCQLLRRAEFLDIRQIVDHSPTRHPSAGKSQRSRGPCAWCHRNAASGRVHRSLARDPRHAGPGPSGGTSFLPFEKRLREELTL